MDDITPKKKSHLDELEQKLYNPEFQESHRHRRKIHDKEIELKSDFDNSDDYEKLVDTEPKYKLPTSFFKKIFLITLGFFIVASSILAFSFYEGNKRVSQDLIAMEILGNPFVDGGEPLTLEIKVQNFNQQNLELPDLVITYPKDSSPNAEMVIDRRSLPDLKEGDLAKETFSFPLFGQEGDARTIKAMLEYRIAGSSAIFVKEVSHSVIIRSTPTELSIDAPTTLVRNQNIVFGVKVRSNTSNPVQNSLLEIQYPPGFTLLDTNTPQYFSNNVWYFDQIPDSGIYVEVVGTLSALENQSQSFHVRLGEQSTENKNTIGTVFNALTHVVDVQRPFIETTLSISGETDGENIIRGGSDIPLRLRYKNTLEESLDNVRIQINLDGDIYDTSRINLQNGFYDSANKAIVFDQTTLGQLSSLSPGQEGEINFTLFGKNLVSNTGILTNPQLEISVDASATKRNGQFERAFNLSRHVVKANSDIAVLPLTQYQEGPFQNSGPLPPRVNVSTTYTVVFQVTNSSNNLDNVELSTLFAPNVVWMGNISPSIERSNVSYDPITRKMIWKIPKLAAGVGVGNTLPQQLSVQVQMTPSAAQVGNAVDLTGDINLSGTDTFTGTVLKYTKGPLTNRIVGSSVPGADGRVVQ